MAAQHSQQEEVTESWEPSYISNAEFSQLMLEALDQRNDDSKTLWSRDRPRIEKSLGL